MDSDKAVQDSMLFRELLGSAGWDRFVGYAEKEEHDVTERLLRTGETPEYARGYVMGLRWAIHHPQRIIDYVKTYREQTTNG